MSGNLPTWIERLLGIEAGPGEGTVWRLEHTWAWPPWVTLLFAIFAVAWVVGVYLREGRTSGVRFRMVLAAVRLSLVAIVLAMLAQFALSLHRTGLPYLVVLVDDSGSMSTPDRYDEKLAGELRRRLKEAGLEDGQLSRLGLAKMLLLRRGGEFLTAVARDYKLRVYFLEDSSAGARPSTAADHDALLEEIKSCRADRQSTRLGSAVRTILGDLRGTAPAAIVLLTDGVTTEGPPLSEAAAYARRKGVPLLAVGLGDERAVRNLKLGDLLVEEVVFVDDVVNFEAKLTGDGFAGRTVAVTLHEEGKPEVLARIDAVVGPDGKPQQVRIPYRPTRQGDFRYVVEVEPLEGELHTEDNRLRQTVHVRKGQIRVLLAAGYPDFEFRYLRNMLGRDKTIALDTVLADADPEHAEQDDPALRVFPVKRDELFRYDVIILGDFDPALLSDATMKNLVDFVREPGKGGALVLVAGPRRFMPAAYRGTPLAPLMPIDPGSARYPEPGRPLTDGFVVEPTELGLAAPPMQLGDTPAESRQIWEKLPPLYWMVETPDLKPGARVLAEHPSRTGHEGRKLPIITMQYVGAGKVLFHATDETWRWRWRTGDVFFARYWIQMIRYLSRPKLADSSRQVELSADRRKYRQGESVRLRATFADPTRAPAEEDGVTVVLEHRGHKTRRIKLHQNAFRRGIFEAVVSQPPIGDYHAWIAVPTVEDRKPTVEDRKPMEKGRESSEKGRAPAVDFTVEPQPGEKQRLRMDAAALRRAAERTKGRFYTAADADRLLDDLPEGRQVPVETLEPKTLWNRWPLLLLFLGLLITEWVLRKSGGMV